MSGPGRPRLTPVPDKLSVSRFDPELRKRIDKHLAAHADLTLRALVEAALVNQMDREDHTTRMKRGTRDE